MVASVPASGSGSLNFALNGSFTPGNTYQARLYPQSGNYTRLAQSGNFTVQSVATYQLIVNGGTGGGSGIPANALRSISANPPTG